jgi:hypothetical protein
LEGEKEGWEGGYRHIVISLLLALISFNHFTLLEYPSSHLFVKYLFVVLAIQSDTNGFFFICARRGLCLVSGCFHQLLFLTTTFCLCARGRDLSGVFGGLFNCCGKRGERSGVLLLE